MKSRVKFKVLILTIISLLLLNSNILPQDKPKGMEELNLFGGEYNTIRAVIIGVSEYSNPRIEKLDYAHSDAISFYNFLRSSAGGSVDSSNIKLLINKDAIEKQIWYALDWIVAESGEKDLAIFYFSGHGDLETKIMGNVGFLLAYDAPEASYRAGGAIDLIYLQLYLKTLAFERKSQVILISDACKSGRLAGGIEGVTLTAEALQGNWGDVVKILSSQPGELSYESERWGNGSGVFTYYLLRGLKGLADLNNDKQVTLKELDIFLSQNIPLETEYKQNPTVLGEAKTLLTNVDSLTLASLLDEDLSKPGGELLAMKGNDQSSPSFDTTTSDLLKKFQLCLNTGQLIYPADDKENALDIYNELKDREDLSTAVSSMKYSLIAALQNNTQKLISNYLQGKVEEEEPVDINLAYEELDNAYWIIDTTYILYDQIRAKHYFMESLFYTNNEFDKRIELLNECINIQPDASYAYCELGRAYHDAKSYDNAIVNYNKAIELSPRWKYPYYNAGIVFADLKQNEKSIEYTNKALEIDPNYPNAYHNLGFVYSNMGDQTKAIEYYSKAVKIDPNYKLGYYNLGIVYYDLEQMDKARENFYKATEIDPSYSDAYNYLGLTYYNDGDYDKAIEYYNKTLAIDPNYFLGYYNSGIAYYDLKQMDKARENFYKATEIDPSYSDAYNYLGLTYYVNADYDKAIEYYDKALAIDSNYILGYYNSGIVYYNLENMNKARENFQKAAEIDPSYTDAYNYLGITYYYEGDYANAIEYYNKVVEIDPNYKLAYYNLGLVYSDLGETENALLNYNQTIKLDSNYINTYDKAGIIYYQLNDYESGIKIYNKYIQFYPADSYGYQMRGLNYFYNGEYDNALKDLQMVVEINPDVPDGYYNLACYYSVIDNAAESLANLEKAFQLGYNNFDHIEKDSDLDGIRSNPDFNKLIEKYKK